MLNQLPSKSPKPNILIVDDDESMREVLTAFFLKAEFSPVAFESPQRALEELRAKAVNGATKYDLIVCDLKMPEMDGIEFVGQVNDLQFPPPVILITAHASVETAVEGLGKGAFDYITKPINFNELSVISDRALRIHRLEENYRSIKKQLAGSFGLEDIAGKSPQMQKVFEAIKRISQSSCNVVIIGESGTGKDMVARAIHARGPRAKKPFVAINCTAIPDTLLESELFGHAKGSFTGATERRRGLLEDAHEGTVFLDEIGDMPLGLQAKLLRFLQERKVKPVGENTYRVTDVRVIAATHCNLKEAVKSGRFREDLYFRLCVVPIEIPPLRQRKEDIILLSEHFLEKYSKKMDSKVIGFTRSAFAKLTRLSWPGNVRELENTIERAIVFCDGTLIDERDIVVTDISEPAALTTKLFTGLKSLREFEKEYIEYVLLQTGNKKEKAAEVLRISRKTLYRKQRDYGIAQRAATV